MEIKNEVGEDDKLIEPLRWYFSYVKVRPFWIDNVLQYTAAISLILTTPYIEYELNLWPMPLNNLGTTMTVLISATHIGQRHIQSQECISCQKIVELLIQEFATEDHYYTQNISLVFPAF